MKKLRIAILFGGNSSEYSVSLHSAYSVIKHMNPSKYELILVGITKNGNWYRYSGSIENIPDDTWHQDKTCRKAILSPSREDHGILEFCENEVKVIPVDAVLPILHGKFGEDGTLQGLIELAGIPLIGCDTMSSALCMDKDYAHKIASLAGVKVPASILVTFNDNNKSSLFDTIHEQTRHLYYPLFVKPVKAGSSYGITKVSNKDMLVDAVKTALLYDSKVIIEETIDGFEVGCAILGNDDLLIGEVDEIELVDGFFDYTEKYTLKTSKIHMPARISEITAKKVKETARILYNALGCKGFARVDMFLTKDNDIVFNEVNTIPGFTSHSRYPNMLKGIGLTFEDILDKLIETAVIS